MPGLVGFCGNNLAHDSGQASLARMRNLITYYPYYAQDKNFSDGLVFASRSHINVIEKEPQPAVFKDVYVWLDGEFYNSDILQELYGLSAAGSPDLLGRLYIANSSFDFLRDIDGIYSAIIYDAKKKKVFLISDRYGFRHLYYMINGGTLVWGSEVKAMLGFNVYSPKISQQALSQFLGIGYLLGNSTWFEGVELVPSGCVLEWDIVKCSVQRRPYWSWDKIQLSKNKQDHIEIADELGRLFENAVRRRCSADKSVGVTLSGGLDSRAILAAVPKENVPLHAVTFGRKESLDAKIAARVANVKGCRHHVFELNAGNWLLPRFLGVWATDGQLDLMHMHGIEARAYIRELYQVNLNGFLGDAVLGGSYLDKASLDSGITSVIASKRMGCAIDLIPDLGEYRSFGKTDFYFLQNRARRFISGGIKHSLVSIEQRKPFFDNKLVEFVYSLPDSLRYDNYLYSLMLLRKFPQYFNEIPWQNTGTPITANYFLSFVNKNIRRIRCRFPMLSRALLHTDTGYANYPDWIRANPAKSEFEEILKSPKALYPDYISRNKVIEQLTLHMGGLDCSANLCRYLTFELWLQQVFLGNYRTGYSFSHHNDY